MKNKAKSKVKSKKEKVMKQTKGEESVTRKEIKDIVNVAIATKSTLFGSNFEGGHISKMSSLIKVSDMMVDYTYQRHAVNTKIKRIVKNFNPDLLGVITCSMRDDNTLAVIDGSHRYHALIQMGMADMNVNALVYFGLSIKDEANIFALTNKEHTKPTPSQIFKAGIISGDSVSNEIHLIAKKSGAIIDEKPGVGIVRCIATLRRVYTNAGADILEKTLTTLQGAYPDSNDTFHSQMVSAVGCIYNRYGNKVDKRRMTDALVKIGSPALAIARAQTMLSSGKTITYTSLPYLIVNQYNVKLKINRLPDFPMNLLPFQVWTEA